MSWVFLYLWKYWSFFKVKPCYELLSLAWEASSTAVTTKDIVLQIRQARVSFKTGLVIRFQSISWKLKIGWANKWLTTNMRRAPIRQLKNMESGEWISEKLFACLIYSIFGFFGYPVSNSFRPWRYIRTWPNIYMALRWPPRYYVLGCYGAPYGPKPFSYLLPVSPFQSQTR